MFIALNDISLLFILFAVMALLFTSLFVAFSSSQRKKLQYHKDMQALREQQQNQLIEAAIRSEELERHRIAEALHDEVGAILSSTKLHFQGIKESSMDERDKQLYEKGKELLDEGIQKVRGISHNLHSNILKEFGLNEAIRHFLNKITQGSLIQCTTELDNNHVTQNPENDMSIYRLVQELVNNILKHAKATTINISSAYTNNNLEMNIAYNGNGLSQQQFEALRYSKEGLGLKNIQNRIILLHGNIQFFAEENNNRIHIQLPVNTAV